MSKRVNIATDIVQRAQAMYPGRLQAAVDYIGKPAYGKQIVSRATADRQLIATSPDEMAALAQTDPAAYSQAQQRLGVLQQQASDIPTLPAQDQYEAPKVS